MKVLVDMYEMSTAKAQVLRARSFACHPRQRRLPCLASRAIDNA